MRRTLISLFALAAVLLVSQNAAAQTLPGSTGEVFRQEGLASWYGPQFEGRPTASGEIFDSSQFTAAHPTLPFGTFLVVTNRNNNRQVSVRVNDRGPFVDGRIIDVSRAAAEHLDMLVTGIAPVLIETIPAPSHQPAFAPPPQAQQPQPTFAQPPQHVQPLPPTFAQPLQVERAPPSPALAPPPQPQQPVHVSTTTIPAEVSSGTPITINIFHVPDGSGGYKTAGVTVSPTQPAAVPQQPWMEQPPQVFPQQPWMEQPPQAIVPQPWMEPPQAVAPQQPWMEQPPQVFPQQPWMEQPPQAIVPQPWMEPPQAAVPQQPWMEPPQAAVPQQPWMEQPPQAIAPQPWMEQPLHQAAAAPPQTILGAPVISANPHGTYRVQVGSFRVARNAVDTFVRLRAANFEPHYERNGEFFRVVIAGIRGTEILSAVERLAIMGYREIIVTGE